MKNETCTASLESITLARHPHLKHHPRALPLSNILKEMSPQSHSKSQRNRPKLRLQGTRKVGCPAGIQIREYILYPEYKVTANGQNNWQLRKEKESMLKNLNKDLLAGKEVNTVKRYYVCLPSEEAHHKTHMTGGMHALAQRVHPKVQMKIQEIVGAGITEVSEVKRALRLYISKELSFPNPPNRDDRAYYPTNHDLSNHIYKAKSLLQLSKPRKPSSKS